MTVCEGHGGTSTRQKFVNIAADSSPTQRRSAIRPRLEVGLDNRQPFGVAEWWLYKQDSLESKSLSMYSRHASRPSSSRKVSMYAVRERVSFCDVQVRTTSLNRNVAHDRAVEGRKERTQVHATPISYPGEFQDTYKLIRVGDFLDNVDTVSKIETS